LSSYSVELSSRARKQFEALPISVAVRLKPHIAALAEQPRPHGVKKLAGVENAWRVRVGDYRIVYEIFDKLLTVLVIQIARRDSVYK
jgi:mRNA interferase RelE/StbE